MNWSKLVTKLEGVDSKHLHKLNKAVKKELARRWAVRQLEAVERRHGFAGLDNFMAGVTHALACRAALRESKEHPPIGKRPASGEMWLPREMLFAVRDQVKRRGWHPLTCTANETLGHLRGEVPGPALYELPIGEFNVAEFKVRMAAPVSAVSFMSERAWQTSE